MANLIPETAELDDKKKGIDLLRRAFKILNHCKESFLQRFTTLQLLMLARGYIDCEWDILPDRWDEKQIIDLIWYGKVPMFDENQKPIYTDDVKGGNYGFECAVVEVFDKTININPAE